MTQQEFFDRYTYSVLKDRIGGGGFGTVYKAYDNVLHRDVAIKVSEIKTTADGKKTFSLKDEFEALGHVPKHPNIANYEELYTFESPQGVFDYAIMQYYPDGNLASLIKEGLTDEQKEDVAKQLLDGVAFLHRHNVVHRDLKPGNILIVKHGGKVIPLITDFGLSKTTQGDFSNQFSNSFGGGTQRYSSPEQLQGKPLRFNTDLWSYGAILYELFTGRPVFESGSGANNTAQADLEIYNKIIHGNVDSRVSSLPGKWSVIAKRCLVVDPEQRAKSADEFTYLFEETSFDTPLPKGSRSAVTNESVNYSSEATKMDEPPVQQKQQEYKMEEREWRKAERKQKQTKAASEPTVEAFPAAKQAPARKSHTVLWITLVLLLVAAIGGLVYYMLEDANARRERIAIIYNEKVDNCEFNLGKMVRDKSGKVGNELFVIPALECLKEIEKMEKGDDFKTLNVAPCFDDLFSQYKSNLREAGALIEVQFQEQIDEELDIEDNDYYMGLLRRQDLIQNLLKQSKYDSALEMEIPKAK